MNKNYFKSKIVIITGGTGFIGSHVLTEILNQNPSKVLVISRGSKTDRIKKHLSRINLKVYNSSREYVKYIIDFNADYLFVLGGNADPRLSVDNPKADFDHNLRYNFNLLEKLRKIKNSKLKIIYISSVAIYGDSKDSPFKEEISSTMPKSPYGINKLAMEGYIRFYSEHFGIKGFSIRLFSTYGPQLTKQVVYDLIKKILDNPEILIIRGDGSEVRDLNYIDDQINGLLLLSQKAKYSGEVYNLGSGVGISIADLAEKITKLMYVSPKIVYKKQSNEKYYGDKWVADISKVKNLKHHPKTSIEDGLRKTIAWIKKL